LIPFHWNEATKVLTIGKRKGEFQGMLVKRVFKIVFVHDNFGVGGAEVDKPSSEIVYTGESLIVRL
jgi:alpha-D-xyloside xylohydrolase